MFVQTNAPAVFKGFHGDLKHHGVTQKNLENAIKLLRLL